MGEKSFKIPGFKMQKISPISVNDSETGVSNINNQDDTITPFESPKKRHDYNIVSSPESKEVFSFCGKRKAKLKPKRCPKKIKKDEDMLAVLNTSAIDFDSIDISNQTIVDNQNQELVNKKKFRKSIKKFVEDEESKKLIREMTSIQKTPKVAQVDSPKHIEILEDEKIESFESPDKINLKQKSSDSICQSFSVSVDKVPRIKSKSRNRKNLFPCSPFNIKCDAKLLTPEIKEKAMASTLSNFKKFASIIQEKSIKPVPGCSKNSDISQMFQKTRTALKPEENEVSIFESTPPKIFKIKKNVEKSILEATPTKCKRRNRYNLTKLAMSNFQELSDESNDQKFSTPICTFESPSKNQDLTISQDVTPKKLKFSTSPLYSLFPKKDTWFPNSSAYRTYEPTNFLEKIDEEETIFDATPPKSIKKRVKVMERKQKPDLSFENLQKLFSANEKIKCKTKHSSSFFISSDSDPNETNSFSIQVSHDVKKNINFEFDAVNVTSEKKVAPEHPINEFPEISEDNLEKPSDEIMFTEWFKPASQLIDMPLNFKNLNISDVSPHKIKEIESEFKTPIKEAQPIGKYEAPKDRGIKTDIDIFSTPQHILNISAHTPEKKISSDIFDIEAETEENYEMFNIVEDNETTPKKQDITHYETPSKEKPEIHLLESPKEKTLLEEIDNNSFSEICFRQTETEQFVYQDVSEKKRKPKAGSLLEKVYNITSRIDTSLTLFDYELKSGLRPSSGRYISSPLELIDTYQEDGLYFLNCKPKQCLDSAINSLIIVANVSKNFNQKYIFVHFPLTVVLTPELETVFVLVGNQICSEDNINLTVDKRQNNSKNHFGLTNYYKKPIIRSLQSNIANSVLDILVGQLIMPELIFNLLLLHIFSLKGDNYILGLDIEGQFCVLQFSAHDLERIKNKKNLQHGTTIFVKGFYVFDILLLDEDLCSLLEYSSGKSVDKDHFYVLTPAKDKWEVKATKRALDKRKTVTTIELVIAENNEYKRYKINAVTVISNENGVYIGDNSLSTKVKVNFLDTDEISDANKIGVLDGVFYRTGTFLVDKYTKIIYS